MEARAIARSLRTSPIRTRITHNTLIEVIFSLNRKYSNINTNTGAVLNRIAARDNGTVLMELL